MIKQIIVAASPRNIQIKLKIVYFCKDSSLLLWLNSSM